MQVGYHRAVLGCNPGPWWERRAVLQRPGRDQQHGGRPPTRRRDPEPEETDPVEPHEPLTASVQDVPGSHDGQNVFTFELRFSEELKSGFSFRTLRDHALTAAGGDITRAKRLDGSGNRRWDHPGPAGRQRQRDRLLPATTDCAAEHAICTEDGRPLSGGITVSGP